MVKRSIFRKLLVTMIGLIIALLMLLTFIQIEFQKDVFEKELEKRIVLLKGRLIDRGQILSSNLSGQVENGLASVNLSLIGDQLRKSVRENKELHYIILMQASGKAYIHTLRPELEMEVLPEKEDLFAAAQRTPTVNEYTSKGKSFVEFIMPIQVSAKPWGVLRLGFSLDILNQEIVNSQKESTRQIREMITRLLITATIFIMIGAGIVLFVSERLSRPLMHLTRLADELAKGNFIVSDSVRRIRADGEIGALKTAFTEMAENLKISYDKLEEYSRTLEQKVVSRTSELAEARDQAVAADKSKSDFLSMMSHEIRTPMNAIIGMTRLALQTDLTANQHDYLTKVHVSSHALLAIINDILDFSKIEAGKLELEAIKFNLDDVLNNLFNLMSDKAEEKDLQIHFVAPDNVPLELIGDPLRLGQVLLNFVSNAIKFTDHGSVTVRVALAEDCEQLKTADRIMLEFSVEDTGIGLTKEQMGGLFQSFSQADKSTTRKYGGTGLGLAICKRIVDMMGGTISVKSESGKGSTFTFTTTFEQPYEVEQKRASLPDVFCGVKALVVDNDETARNALCSYLEALLFEVTCVNTGEQAIQMLENAYVEEPYRLVVMNWNLPKMDGISAARHIKSNLKIACVPYIIMIAHSKEYIAKLPNDLNLDGFLTKPVHSSELSSAVIEAFNQNNLHDNSLSPIRRMGVKNEKLQQIRGAKLLLVEDNIINQQVAKETLEQEGFEVAIAEDGLDAVQKVRANYFDAVLMDLEMPIMDGYEATRIIRSESRFDNLPIIAMTAHAMNDVRNKCLRIGMDGYVTKPIDVDELLGNLIEVITPELRKIPASYSAKTDQQKVVLLPDLLPGIDIQQGLKNVVGNAQLLRNLLLKFDEGFSDAPTRLDAFLQIGNVEAALAFLHIMKGIAANLAMPELRGRIQALEQAFKNQSQYEPELVDFAAAHNRVLESIRQLLCVKDKETESTASLN